ncbi:hypothetical protein [Aminobacter aminovorans]|nr:hypothetical protein [Aminobacter aminovorans]MDR7221607.1 hypothetical protein [Aminobacter aminovorans]
MKRFIAMLSLGACSARLQIKQHCLVPTDCESIAAVAIGVGWQD